jgi:cell wall-associated NlpC family hydrolase
MPRGANSCARIWGSSIKMPIAQLKIRSRLFGAVALWCAIAPLLLVGCSSSSPRFISKPAARVEQEPDEEDEFRFATRIRAEEKEEDDRTVDVEKMRKKLTPERPASERYTNRTPRGLDRDRLLLDVVSYLGTPYLYGGNTREGIDCSGFTARVYESGALKQLPRSAKAQFSVGSPVAKSDLEFGDLVFFNTTGRRPSHVGIYIEDDLFAHASVTRGVTFSSLESTYYRKRYVGARRIMKPEDAAASH